MGGRAAQAATQPDCSQPRPSSSLAVHLGEHLVCVQLPFVVAQHPTDTALHDMQHNPLLSVSRSPADFLESMDPSVRIKLRSMFDDGLVGYRHARTVMPRPLPHADAVPAGQHAAPSPVAWQQWVCAASTRALLPSVHPLTHACNIQAMAEQGHPVGQGSRSRQIHRAC